MELTKIIEEELVKNEKINSMKKELPSRVATGSSTDYELFRETFREEAMKISEKYGFEYKEIIEEYGQKLFCIVSELKWDANNQLNQILDEEFKFNQNIESTKQPEEKEKIERKYKLFLTEKAKKIADIKDEVVADMRIIATFSPFEEFEYLKTSLSSPLLCRELLNKSWHKLIDEDKEREAYKIFKEKNINVEIGDYMVKDMRIMNFFEKMGEWLDLAIKYKEVEEKNPKSPEFYSMQTKLNYEIRF